MKIFLNSQEVAKLIPHDKALHIAVGLTLYGLGAIWMPIVGLILAVVFAVGKEIKDEIVYGGFDWKDLLFTIAVPIILYVLNLLYNMRG